MFLCFISLWTLYCSLRSNPSSTENIDNYRNEKSKFPSGVFCSPLKGQRNILSKSTVQAAEKANSQSSKVIQRANQILYLFSIRISRISKPTQRRNKLPRFLSTACINMHIFAYVISMSKYAGPYLKSHHQVWKTLIY